MPHSQYIDVQMVGIGLAIALASIKLGTIPAGIFAVKIGNRQAMLCGICALVPSLLISLGLSLTNNRHLQKLNMRYPEPL